MEERRIRREVVLPEPPDEVWEALTEPERLEEWFVVDPQRRFGFRWVDEEGEGSRVDFTLVPDEDGTRLVVVEQTAEWSTALELRASALSGDARPFLARDHAARQSSLARDQGVQPWPRTSGASRLVLATERSTSIT